MAWTPAELEQIRAAILALATGQRVASVTYSNPSRTVSYVPADLKTLRELLADGASSATGTTRFRRAAISKGFDPPRDNNG